MFKFSKKASIAVCKSSYNNVLNVQHRFYARQNPNLFTYLSEGQGNLHTPYPVATVFGASGFIGKYICAELARIGYQVITPYRFNEEDVMKHKTMGDVGQVVSMRYSPRQYDSIIDICARSNIVVNAVGRSTTPFFSFRDTFHYSNVEVPALIAQACADTNVSRFIHISHMGADLNQSNLFLRKKAEAENRIKEIYPDVTIFRPNIAVGGFPDRFSSLFGKWCRTHNYFPLMHSGEKLFQPIFAPNIADSVVEALKRPYTLGETYELAGPHVISYKDFAEKVSDCCNWPANVIKNNRNPISRFLQNHEILPGTTDQFLRRTSNHYLELMDADLVLPPGTRNTIQSLGVLPSPIEHFIEKSLATWYFDPDVIGGYIHDIRKYKEDIERRKKLLGDAKRS